MNRVLVLGGYGLFGGRLVQRLARLQGLHVLVAGRSLDKAQAWIARQSPAAATLQPFAVDAQTPGLEAALTAADVGLVVHTAGPFQGQDYRVARACIAASAHCVDLADATDFVTGISTLDAAAQAAGVAVVSGASSVPALSSTVVDALCAGWQRVDRIEIGISPGNRTERGLSTVQAILSYCGAPLPGPASQAAEIGWRGAYRHRYPAPVGPRWLSPCDVPDRTLLPQRYPGSPVVRFGAGLELSLLHRGMNAMAWMRQQGLVRNWSVHARWLTRAADALRHFGTDAGAMHVKVQGLDGAGHAAQRLWQLVATADDGPFVPTLAAAALVRRWANGQPLRPGASPCLGMLSLADFAQSAQGLHIQMDGV